ncbi:MAG TPA: NAD(P)/FAD-dependent oxidoreductase [Streptosporangiaceae bacterium]|nr:NAD(P)/FAD-dependent oxidoreductase [Streptosporangiaceae bacterium]
MTDADYDVVVIGAGPVGENVAARVRRGGLSAAVVESELVGGECSYWACIPSKALLRPPAALAEARAVDGARQAITGELSAEAVFARRTRFTGGWVDDSGQVAWLDGKGADLIRGRGRLAGARRVEVDTPEGGTATLVARHAVVVATGSTAAIPPVPGLAEPMVWTSRDATSADQVPGRLAVLGGGVVACEMASAWCALGAEVTVLARGPRLLDRMEPFAGELVAASLQSAGVKVRTNTSITRVRRLARATPVEIWTGQTGASPSYGQPADLIADELLVATGRVPRTTGLGLETIGLAPGSWLEVDDTCLVSAVAGGWLYAAGDVNHRNLLTHMGKYQARACGDAIAARARGELTGSPAPWSGQAASADHAGAPQVIFTNPEVAAVGLTEREAASRDAPVRAVDYEIGQVAGASLYADGYSGRARFVVDTARRVLLGATFVGPGISELLHAATIAVVGEVPLDRLWHAVPSYPTVSEVWLRLLETYGL